MSANAVTVASADDETDFKAHPIASEPVVQHPLTPATDKVPSKEWVRFEDGDEPQPDTGLAHLGQSEATQKPRPSPTKQPSASPQPIPPPRAGAVLPTPPSTTVPDSITNQSTVPVATTLDTSDNVHIAFNNTAANNNPPPQLSTTSSPAVIDIPIVPTTTVSSVGPITNPGLRTIELSSGRIREGFANGDIIVTLLPVNTKWPWITPAVFRPELVPEELMAQGLTLTVEEYVHAMETLVNDYRFTMYNICYKRILCCWILFAFAVLMGLLFSGLNGIVLFSLGVGWLFLNAAAIFLCMWMKLRLSRGLERCMASVNKQLLRHKIILVLDDRGKISCHKVNLCFMYFESAQCVGFLNELIERSEANGTTIEAGWESRLDVPVNDIVIQGSSTTRVSRKQERGELLLLRYAARWGKEVMRGQADVHILEAGRHCAPFTCPCQYIERHLKCKPRGKSKYFLVCDGLLAAERCDSFYFIFFSIFLILGMYAMYMVDYQSQG